MLFLLLLGIVAGIASGGGVWIRGTEPGGMMAVWLVMVIVGGLAMGVLFIGWIVFEGVAIARANAKHRDDAERMAKMGSAYGQPVQVAQPQVSEYYQQQQPPTVGP